MANNPYISEEIRTIIRKEHERILRDVKAALEKEWNAIPSEKRRLLQTKYGSKQQFIKRIGEWVVVRVISDKVAKSLNIDLGAVLSFLGLRAPTEEKIEGGLANFINSMTPEQRELFAPLVDNVERLMGSETTAGAVLEEGGLFDYSDVANMGQEEIFAPFVESFGPLAGDFAMDIQDDGGDSLVEWLCEMFS